MFDFNSSLFWYKLLFMAELLVAAWLFADRLKRRPMFWLRVAGGAAIAFVAAFLFPVLFYNAWYTSLLFLCLFLVTIPVMKLCYDEPWVNIVFCGIAAYTTQHLAYEAFNLVMLISGFDLGIAIGMYGYALPPNINIFTVLVYSDFYGLVYFLLWFLFARRISKHEDMKVNASFLLLSAAILLVDIVLSAVVTYNSSEHYDKVYLSISHIYNMLCCVFAVSIQFGLLFRRRLRKELDAVNRLLQEGREQYEVSKQNIELINRKCHDLKHQIRLIGMSGEVRDKTISEISDAISIYDSSVQTGNEALDIILTEKSLGCSRNGIKLTCIADGKAMDFMDVSDIYTLLGNGIDNAIEAVMKADSPDKRFIRLKATARGSLLSVRLENWYDGYVKFKDGLPVTTKAQDGYHGYGMKSMRFIAEKYNGDMTVKTEGHMFVVEILLPIPKPSEGDKTLRSGA